MGPGMAVMNAADRRTMKRLTRRPRVGRGFIGNICAALVTEGPKPNLQRA